MGDLEDLHGAAMDVDEPAIPNTDPASNRKGRQDAIVVCARFRPMNSMETSRGSESYAEVHDDGMGVTVMQGEHRQKHTFTFDRCFGPDSEQSEVYDHTGRPIVADVLEGYYGTVFAYGQTGSGKTFTMEGAQVQICNGQPPLLLPSAMP